MVLLINVLVHIKSLFSKRKNMDSLLCCTKLGTFRRLICLLYPFVHRICSSDPYAIPSWNSMRMTCSDSFVSSSVSSRLEFHVVVWEETQQMAVHDINYLCRTLLLLAGIVRSRRAPPTPWLRVETRRTLLSTSALWGITFARWIKNIFFAESAKILPPDLSRFILAWDSEGLLHTDRLQLSAEASPRVFLLSPMFLSSTTCFMFLIALLLQNLGRWIFFPFILIVLFLGEC